LWQVVRVPLGPIIDLGCCIHNLVNTKNNNYKLEIEDEAIEKAPRESADPLPYRGGEAWQGDFVDEKSTSNQKKPSHKNQNTKMTNEKHNSNSDNLGEINNTTFKFENSDEDASIFNTICGNDLKKQVAKNVKLSMKMDTVDIFITGPFCNTKIDKSSWIIVCGDYGSAWTLKLQFIKGYIGTLLTKIKKASHQQ
jgi:hypothetical protein